MTALARPPLGAAGGGLSPDNSGEQDAAQIRHGLLLVAAAAIVWSSGGLIVRLLGPLDVWTVVFWRSLFAFLFLLLFILLRDRGRAPAAFRSMGRPGLVVAACFATASIALVVALKLTSVANTLIILSTAPLIAALLGRVVLGEGVKRRSWIAMASALAGVAIMVSGSARDATAGASLAGDLVASTIAIALAVAIVTIRKHRSVRMTPATCLGALIDAVIALTLAVTLEVPLAIEAGAFGLLVLFGAGQLGLGLALFTTGARLAPAAQVAFVSLLEPILGPLWVWIFLAEQLSASALLGGGIVLTALLVHTALDLRRARPLPPAI